MGTTHKKLWRGKIKKYEGVYPGITQKCHGAVSKLKLLIITYINYFITSLKNDNRTESILLKLD